MICSRHSLIAALLSATLLFCSIPAFADEIPDAASVSGKYSELVQVLNCPKDGSSYGNFRDYGYWGGGAWCGQQGMAGYWVWVAPNWYVWKQKGAPNLSLLPRQQSTANIPT